MGPIFTNLGPLGTWEQWHYSEKGPYKIFYFLGPYLSPMVPFSSVWTKFMSYFIKGPPHTHTLTLTHFYTFTLTSSHSDTFTLLHSDILTLLHLPQLTSVYEL